MCGILNVFLTTYIRMNKMGLGPSPEDAVRKRRAKQEADDVAKIEKKYRNRGTSGSKQALKEIEALEKKGFQDYNLANQYGTDAMKSRGFGQKTQAPMKQGGSGKEDIGALPNKGGVVKDEIPMKKKAGGMMKKGYAKGKMVKKMMSAGKLVGGQKKLDKNNDGKISGDDFKKMKAGGMTKKGYAQGKMVKKGMAAGGKAKGKAKGGKSKVRGAGIARKGVRAAKMR